MLFDLFKTLFLHFEILFEQCVFLRSIPAERDPHNSVEAPSFKVSSRAAARQPNAFSTHGMCSFMRCQRQEGFFAAAFAHRLIIFKTLARGTARAECVRDSFRPAHSAFSSDFRVKRVIASYLDTGSQSAIAPYPLVQCLFNELQPTERKGLTLSTLVHYARLGQDIFSSKVTL